MAESDADKSMVGQEEVAALRQVVHQLDASLQALLTRMSGVDPAVSIGSADTRAAEPAPEAPLVDLRQLYVTGLQAKADGDLEEAERLWQQILDCNRSYLGGHVDREMLHLQAQLRPKRIHKYREEAKQARAEGAWGEEIVAVEALQALMPQDAGWAKRLQSARQNRDNSELYEVVKALIAQGARAPARDHLQLLWDNAPTYGDPSQLGPQLDYTYAEFLSGREEQARKLRKEIVESQQELEAARAERMRSLVAWEKKTRRGRFRRDILGDSPFSMVVFHICFFACLVVALGAVTNHVSLLAEVVLPYHLTQLILVAVVVVPASVVMYFVLFSPSLSILAFLAVLAIALGLGELLLQVTWSPANPTIHRATLPLWGTTSMSLSGVLEFLLASTVLGAVAALVIGLLLGLSLRLLRINPSMKASIGLSLLYSALISVAYVILVNGIGVAIGYTAAGLAIGIVVALGTVVLRVKDAFTVFFLIVLPTGILLSLLTRLLMFPILQLSTTAANWLAISLVFALLLGYGAGKLLRSSLLGVRYRHRLRRWRKEGFEALSLFIEARGALPSRLSMAEVEPLRQPIEFTA